MSPFPLVSVLVPAYKGQYFERALSSACQQTYPNLEIVVCDDSHGRFIGPVCQAYAEQVSFPIRYSHNTKPLGERGNLARCIELAEGKYVKFLHDDDELQPECIERLVHAMENDSGIALVSSRRRLIDEDGNILPGTLATAFPFETDSIVDGRDLLAFLGDYTINFIGEPSCVMCRREDVLGLGAQLMDLGGKRINWVADLALYANLLRRGNLAMLVDPLTSFRVSRWQASQLGRDQPGIGDKGHADFRQVIRDLGWYPGGDTRLVRVAPITTLKSRVFKPLNLLAAIQRMAGYGGVSLRSWLDARRPDWNQAKLIEERLQALGGGPSIVVLVQDQGDAAAIDRTSASIRDRSLCARVEVVVIAVASQQVVSVNEALATSDSDWVMLVEAGAEFTPCGLLMLALELAGVDGIDAVYGDELIRDEDGELGVALKPDFNLDMLISFPAGMARHWLYRRAALMSQGGFPTDCGQSFELAYQLSLIERLGLGCVGHISEPLLASDALPLRTISDEQTVILRHLQARGYENAEVGSQLPGRYQVSYGHQLQASVSILIVVRDRLAQLQRCLETLLENTTHLYYEIMLLDHGNGAPSVQSWLAGVERMDSAQIQVLHFPEDISPIEVRNQAALQARGDFLLWLGDGAGILQQDWLQQLLNHGLRPEVGAVGAKLLRADGRIYHGGLLLGLGGPAGRAFEGTPHDAAGYMQRLQIDQNFSALSSDCLLVRRELFTELGGFSDEADMERWADVDLCLRIGQAGYLNVWTPRVQLLMDVPVEEAATTKQEDAFYARWLPAIACDPAYNSCFSLRPERAFKLADPQLSWRPLQSWRPLPTILAHQADMFGCGQYRVIQPFQAMQADGLIEGVLSPGLMPLVDLQRYAPDVLVLQRQVRDDQLDAMRRMKMFSRAFKVYELDDYLPNLPIKSAHRQHMPKDILKSLRRGLGYVDRFVVSTEALAEALADLHPDIRVVENRLPVQWWGGLPARCGRKEGGKPRVGWAGGVGHAGDLEMIKDVIIELADEVDWVFFGMCPESVRPYVREFYAGVAIDLYPTALAALELDLAVAPVEQNLFNDCKSNLRLLEYGACGVPVICSDVRCYQGSLPVTRVKNRFRDWVEAIRMHVTDLEASRRAGESLLQVVRRDWMLEGEHVKRWLAAWTGN